MTCKVVGYSSIFTYSDKSGEKRQARNLYIVRKPTPRESGNIGMVAQSIFLPEIMFSYIPVGGFDAKKEYELIYDSDGRFTYLSAIREVI